MRLEGSFIVAAPQAQVWTQITDAALMAACIPGCEDIEVVDARTYRARVKVEVGPVKARFNLLVEVTEEVAPSRVLSLTRGEEGTRASVVSAENELLLIAQDAATTEVRYISEVSVTGRLGKFGLGVMKKKAQGLSEEFVANFRARVELEAAR
jgi:carbon monoxide dehydrogenase subunit G